MKNQFFPLIDFPERSGAVLDVGATASGASGSNDPEHCAGQEERCPQR